MAENLKFSGVRHDLRERIGQAVENREFSGEIAALEMLQRVGLSLSSVTAQQKFSGYSAHSDRVKENLKLFLKHWASLSTEDRDRFDSSLLESAQRLLAPIIQQTRGAEIRLPFLNFSLKLGPRSFRAAPLKSPWPGVGDYNSRSKVSIGNRFSFFKGDFAERYYKQPHLDMAEICSVLMEIKEVTRSGKNKNPIDTSEMTFPLMEFSDLFAEKDPNPHGPLAFLSPTHRFTSSVEYGASKKQQLEETKRYRESRGYEADASLDFVETPILDDASDDFFQRWENTQRKLESWVNQKSRIALSVYLKEHHLEEIYSLGVRLYGRKFSGNHLAFLKKNKEVLLQLYKENPKMTGVAVHLMPFLCTSNTLDVNFLKKSKDALVALDIQPGVWNTVLRQLPRSFFRASNVLINNKKIEFSRGVGISGHQLLKTFLQWSQNQLLKPEHFETIVRVFGLPEDGAYFHGGDADIIDLRLLVRLLHPRKIEISSAEEALAWIEEDKAKNLRLGFLVRSIAETLSKEFDKDRVVADFSDTLDFLEKAEFGIWQNLPEKMTWKSLQRYQKEWHDLMSQKEFDKKKSVKWESSLGVYREEELSAVPLTDAGLLWKEGKEMHHCVSSYAPDCKSNRRRIFSIHRGEEHVATFELRNNGEKWTSSQLRGAWNKLIKDQDIVEFSKSIEKQYMIEDNLKKETKEKERMKGYSVLVTEANARVMGM